MHSLKRSIQQAFCQIDSLQLALIATIIGLIADFIALIAAIVAIQEQKNDEQNKYIYLELKKYTKQKNILQQQLKELEEQIKQIKSNF